MHRNSQCITHYLILCEALGFALKDSSSVKWLATLLQQNMSKQFAINKLHSQIHFCALVSTRTNREWIRFKLLTMGKNDRNRFLLLSWKEIYWFGWTNLNFQRFSIQTNLSAQKKSNLKKIDFTKFRLKKKIRCFFSLNSVREWLRNKVRPQSPSFHTPFQYREKKKVMKNSKCLHLNTNASESIWSLAFLYLKCALL